MKRVLIGCCAALAASSAWALTEYYLKDGVSDWTSDASYKSGKAPATASERAAAVIVVDEGVTVGINVSDVGTTNFITQIDHVYLKKPSSKVIFNTPLATDAISYSKRMSSSAHGSANYSITNGCIVKKGLGKLHLNESSNLNAFSTRIEILEGEVHMSAATSFKPTYGHVAISNGAAFYLPTNCNFCTVAGLWGDGLVTTTGTKTQLRVGQENASFAGQYSEFRGILDTEVYYFSAGCCVLSGLNRTKYPLTAYYGREYLGEKNATGFSCLPAAQGSPSPAGTTYLTTDDGGGNFVYYGTNTELFSTALNYQMKPYWPDVCTFSAGSNGNVRFTGKWSISSSNIKNNGRFCVAGSNTEHACILDNQWSFEWTKDGVDYAFEMIKAGSGIWRVADQGNWNENRAFSGPVDIRAGTLQVDSLYDAGLNSALGKGTCLLEKPALSLGTATSEGTLAYSGDGLTNGVSVMTRPAVLAGNGRFYNDSVRVPFRFCGVSPTTDGTAKTLTLDGASTRANEVCDITDDAANPVGVTKKGTGTWYLTGTNSFHGPIDVQGGKLVVRNCNQHRFDWFRWTVRETSGASHVANCQEFCLYNAQGYRQNSNLAIQTNSYAVGPGEAAVVWKHSNFVWYDFGNSGVDYKGWHHLGRLFDNYLNYPDKPENSSHYRVGWASHCTLNGKTVALSESDSNTYISVVMRLPSTAEEITAYDLVWGNSSGSDPKSYVIEGSVDGFHWQTLKDVTNGGRGSANAFTYKFNSAKSGPDDGLARQNTWVNSSSEAQFVGRATATYPVLNNMSSLAVAADATFEVEGTALAIPALSVSANGAGTIRNVTFPASGTIDVTDFNARNERVVIVPTYENCNTANLASWTVTVDGLPPRKHTASVSAAGTITLLKRGLVIMIR